MISCHTIRQRRCRRFSNDSVGNFRVNDRFSVAMPHGTNASADNAISVNGSPVKERQYEIAARTGRAVRLGAGDTLTIENPSGHQVCDFWAFRDPELTEYLSMAHTHTALQSIRPRVGDTLVSNNRTDMLKFIDDTSPGIHDTVIAACDAMRYLQLGAIGYHDNCTDNLRMALRAIGVSLPAIASPFNIWMNIPVAADGGTQWAAPVSKAGDLVRFLALVDCIAVMSACPQDMTAVNGEGVAPAELFFSVS